MSEYTDAAPLYHRASALTVFGALLTRQRTRCVLHRGVEGTWPTLWTVLLGDSGRSRKSTAIGMAEAVLQRVDSELRGPDDMSPEGLMNHLRVRQTRASDPSSILIFTEFVNLLLQFRRQYSQVLRPTLLKFYDVDRSTKRTLKKETFEINYGRVSMLGGIPAEILATYSGPDEWAGGFFNRCLFIPDGKTRAQQDLPTVPLDVYDNLAKGLSDCLMIWEQTQAEAEDPGTGQRPMFKLSDSALKIGRELKDHAREPHLDSMLSRTPVHFAKVAAIEQVDEDPTSFVIGKAAGERAYEFLKLWQAHLPHLLETCFTHAREDFEADKLPKKIIRYLERCPKLSSPVPALLAHCAMNWKVVNEALETLKQSNRIEMTRLEENEAITVVRLKSSN